MAHDSEAQRAWVLRVLQVDTAGPASEAESVDLQLKPRLDAASRQIEALKAEGDPALPRLLPAQAATMEAVGAGSAEAASLLDTLEAELASALSKARARAAARVSEGAVNYGKLLLRWHAAQDRVAANLQALGQALLTDPELIDDPDFEDIQEAVEDLPDLVPEFGAQLDDLLDEARDDPSRRTELHQEALILLRQYRKRLGAISALKELEGFSAQTGAGSLRLFGEFDDAISALETELAKSA